MVVFTESVEALFSESNLDDGSIVIVVGGENSLTNLD